MRKAIVYLSLIILLPLLANNSSVFAQSAVPENTPIIPDSTGMHYFLHEKSASARDYLSIIDYNDCYLSRKGTLQPRQVIAVMPISPEEFVVFYYFLTRTTEDHTHYRKSLQKAYELLWQYASSDSEDSDKTDCFFVALNMARIQPASLPLEFLDDVHKRLEHMLVGKGAQRLLCLYSAFTDERLKKAYGRWAKSCYYTRYIDPRNLED